MLFFARYEASQLGTMQITPEHILLAVIREAGAGASKVLQQTGLTRSELEERVKDAIGRRDPIGASVEIPFSAQAKQVLQAAAAESDALGHRHIGGEHLLLGILTVQGAPANTALVSRGVTLDGARATIREFEDRETVDDAVGASSHDLPAIRHIRALIATLAAAPDDAERRTELLRDLDVQLSRLNAQMLRWMNRGSERS